MKGLIRKTKPDLYYDVSTVVDKVIASGPEAPGLDKAASRKAANMNTKNVVKTLISDGYTTREKIADNIEEWIRATMAVSTFDGSATVKLCVHYFLYMKCLKNLGTEKHREYVLNAADLTDWGCFGLTELGHGSNVAGCETTAEYDHETKEFVLNSPTQTSIKFWIGNLGQTANIMVCFAQLIVKSKNYGLHAFVVPIRDKTTHLPYDGCRIGDCGDKIGLNGMDNGWIQFTNYRIPVDNLLNRISSITSDGEFSTSISKGSKRFATQLGTLSGGRVLACSNGSDVTLKALVTALRYGSIRGQFARKKNQPEAMILDYPLHQARLIPYFASTFMGYISTVKLWERWETDSHSLVEPKNKDANYLHLMTSAMKPVTTWMHADAVRSARLACAGLGFSGYNNFQQYLGVVDVNQTWEGENHVLIQQAIKIILKSFTDLMQGKDPIKTLEFLADDYDEFSENCKHLNNLTSFLTLSIKFLLKFPQNFKVENREINFKFEFVIIHYISRALHI